MPTVIVANGEIQNSARAQSLLRSADQIIAADGGCRHCLRLGFPPNLLVGDLDSIDGSDLEAVEQAGGIIQRHPTRKDATDLELALHQAIEIGGQEVVILGAVGGRWDQSLANLLLLANPAFDELSIEVVEGRQHGQLARPGQGLSLEGEPGDTVSLIPLSGDARGITTEGLEYMLDGESLSFASSRGVSNVLRAPTARIELSDGLLLVLHIRTERTDST